MTNIYLQRLHDATNGPVSAEPPTDSSADNIATNGNSAGALDSPEHEDDSEHPLLAAIRRGEVRFDWQACLVAVPGPDITPVEQIGATFATINGAAPVCMDWQKQIFSPSAATDRISELETSMAGGSGISSSDPLPFKQTQQAAWWRKMAGDAAHGYRRLVIGTDEQCAAVGNIAKIAPNFRALTDLFRQALRASQITATALHLPPVLLLGPPGIGKTYVSSRIAKAIATGFLPISMTTATGLNPLAGTDLVWGNPKIGKVAEALIEGETASPIIVLDELDKAFHIRGEADPLAPLHALLEPENSSAFRDEYLELPLACDAVIWIFTANDIVGIAPSILDRLLVLDIDPPTQSQMRQVQASIYRDVASAYGEWFEASLAPAITDRLSGISPRQVKRILGLACASAASQSRRHLIDADMDAALRLASPTVKSVRTGFVS